MSARSTIALNMIVKNEAHVIARCLESVKPIVTSFLIVDTGSTDGTQDVVRATMNGIPGELHERPFRNFGASRTEAMELARGKADYLLVIDADDFLTMPEGFRLPELVADEYEFAVEDAGSRYFRIHLFRSDLGYRYEGVVHETLVSDGPRTRARLEGVSYRRTNAGARSSDPGKYRKDAALLAAALVEEPGHCRYAFYFAQSLRDAGDLEGARSAYAKRAEMGGWAEEAWYSLLEVARLGARLGEPEDRVMAACLRAFEYRPVRSEPLVYLAAYLRERGRPAAAYPFALAASRLECPNDILFMDESVYAWRAFDEYAVAAYWAGRYGEALEANQELLEKKRLPESERERVEKNIAFCREKLGLGGAKPGE